MEQTKDVLQVFANVFKWIYRKINYWTMRRKNAQRYEIMEKEIDGNNVEELEEVVIKLKSSFI